MGSGSVIPNATLREERRCCQGSVMSTPEVAVLPHSALTFTNPSASRPHPTWPQRQPLRILTCTRALTSLPSARIPPPASFLLTFPVSSQPSLLPGSLPRASTICWNLGSLRYASRAPWPFLSTHLPQWAVISRSLLSRPHFTCTDTLQSFERAIIINCTLQRRQMRPS